MKRSMVIAVLSVLLSVPANADELALIVHRDAGLTDASRAELARLFLGLARSAGGKKVKAANIADAKLRAMAASRLSGKSPVEVEDHFVKLELRGEGKWPVEAPSAAELVKQVAEAKNLVGCVPVSDLNAQPAGQRENLVVLAIDGKRPGESGYPLTR